MADQVAMTSAPLIRINGAEVQVIIDGWVVGSFPHGRRSFTVDVEENAIEISSDSQTIHRFEIDPDVGVETKVPEDGTDTISVHEHPVSPGSETNAAHDYESMFY